MFVHSVVKFPYAYLQHETNSDRKGSSCVWYSLIECQCRSPIQTAQNIYTYKLVDFGFFTRQICEKIRNYLKYDLAGLKLMNTEQLSLRLCFSDNPRMFKYLKIEITVAVDKISK